MKFLLFGILINCVFLLYDDDLMSGNAYILKVEYNFMV